MKQEEGRLSTNQAQTKHQESINRHYPSSVPIVSRENSFHSFYTVSNMCFPIRLFRARERPLLHSRVSSLWGLSHIDRRDTRLQFALRMSQNMRSTDYFRIRGLYRILTVVTRGISSHYVCLRTCVRQSIISELYRILTNVTRGLSPHYDCLSTCVRRNISRAFLGVDPRANNPRLSRVVLTTSSCHRDE